MGHHHKPLGSARTARGLRALALRERSTRQHRQQGARSMLRRLLPPRLARLGCQPLALRPLLALRTLAAKAGKKAERKAGKKAAQALKFTRVLQEEEALAFRSGKVLAGSAHPSPARPSPAQPSPAHLKSPYESPIRFPHKNSP